MGVKDKISSLIGMSPPKDDSAEAGLSGDLDELPEDEKDPKRDGPVTVEDITEDD